MAGKAPEPVKEAVNDTPDMSAILAAVQAVGSSVESLETRITAVEQRPNTGNHTPKAGEVFGERSEVIDALNPKDPRSFHEGDIIRLNPDSEKFAIILDSLETKLERQKDIPGRDTSGLEQEIAAMKDESGPQGEVWGFMRSNEEGLQKYEVKFPLMGQDGCWESELVMVRRASVQ
jgi:hypothetical protein